ncbi:hypothetical protein D3C73_1268750 [compost metagenome]
MGRIGDILMKKKLMPGNAGRGSPAHFLDRSGNMLSQIAGSFTAFCRDVIRIVNADYNLHKSPFRHDAKLIN